MFQSSTSYDFNAAIAANSANDVFATWTATDPASNVNAEVRIAGRLAADAAGSMNAPGVAIFTSPTAYTDGMATGTAHWGDYPGASVDWQTYTGICASGKRAWIVNQKNTNVTTWGTRVARIGFC